jgi:tyrosine-protein phosphatase YwqE
MEKAYNIIKKKFGAEKANQLFVLNAKTLLNNNGE